jgi:hypothetical protein
MGRGYKMPVKSIISSVVSAVFRDVLEQEQLAVYRYGMESKKRYI